MAKVFTIETDEEQTKVICKVWPSKKAFEKTESWLDEKYISLHYAGDGPRFENYYELHGVIWNAERDPTPANLLALTVAKQMWLMSTGKDFTPALRILSKPPTSDLNHPDYISFKQSLELRTKSKAPEVAAKPQECTDSTELVDKLKEKIESLEKQIQRYGEKGNWQRAADLENQKKGINFALSLLG